MGLTAFSKLAALVTVDDLKSPFSPSVQVDQRASDASEQIAISALEEGCNPMDRASLVLRGAEVIGATWFENLEPEYLTVESGTEEIHPAALVSADTSAIEALKLLTREGGRAYPRWTPKTGH